MYEVKATGKNAVLYRVWPASGAAPAVPGVKDSPSPKSALTSAARNRSSRTICNRRRAALSSHKDNDHNQNGEFPIHIVVCLRTDRLATVFVVCYSISTAGNEWQIELVPWQSVSDRSVGPCLCCAAGGAGASSPCFIIGQPDIES
ncbi:MAG TPA: hypothetical protein VNA04_12435, partial [Thermoanaerobaculia bacterium]|nr:hypothetical protein [Thermoanaerobaculia bacterium]